MERQGLGSKPRRDRVENPASTPTPESTRRGGVDPYPSANSRAGASFCAPDEPAAAEAELAHDLADLVSRCLAARRVGDGVASDFYSRCLDDLGDSLGLTILFNRPVDAGVLVDEGGEL